MTWVSGDEPTGAYEDDCPICQGSPSSGGCCDGCGAKADED